MTENEKAKAYDEALKKASAAHKDEDRHLKATLERIFPELKEDDDERIRKDLIQWIDEFPGIIWRGHYKNDIIAWLEKQGDKDKLIQELGEYKIKYIQEVLEKHITSMSNKDDERLRKNTISFLKEFADLGYENAVECIDWLEKQGEQKPQGKSALEAIKEENVDNANKIEPKFKVGDWIISSVLGTAHIIGTNDSNEFQLEYIDGKQKFSSIDYVNYAYDKWTINYAKNGNVLALSWLEDKNLWEKIIFFKKYHSEGIKGICSMPCVEGYGKTFKNGKMAFTDEKVLYYSKTWICKLHPATKEQRDALMKAINDAGYEWDTEKKELKKKEK